MVSKKNHRIKCINFYNIWPLWRAFGEIVSTLSFICIDFTETFPGIRFINDLNQDQHKTIRIGNMYDKVLNRTIPVSETGS